MELEVEQRRHRIGLIEMATCVVLIATYILPTGLIATQYQISKYFFVGCIFVIYIVYCAQNKKISKREIALIVFLLLAAIATKNVNFIVFITLPFAKIMVQKRDRIVRYLKKSNILYICVLFTAVYSLGCYFFLPKPGNEDHIRPIRTAIVEINQSGLSIFCLGLMLKRKNKRVSRTVLALGILTESRSYFLAIIILLFSKTKIANNLVKLIGAKKWSYLKLTIITSILLLLLGQLFISLYHQGLIIPYNQENKTFALNDYSNFFRFSVIVLLCKTISKNYKFLLLGVPDQEYVELLSQTASETYEIPYSGHRPHNLFFSHLQKYGAFSLVEAYFVSIVCKEIVTKRNFYIYISIILYSFILGAGMYSYWLYLSIFTLIVEM